MDIIIKRTTTNRLYTEGSLLINNVEHTQTIECTEMMLPAGLYALKLIKVNAHLRKLVILDGDTQKSTGQRISPTAISHIGCRREQAIAIGHELIPGALYKSIADYERIVKRIEKCNKRRKPVLLVIDDNECKASVPAKHWERKLKQGETRNAKRTKF